jgi:hypothetical protein
MLPAAVGAPRHRACARIGFPIALGLFTVARRDSPKHPASCEAIMVFKPDLARLSQIEADVGEIDTRAGEADSRMDKPLQNAFGV